jgi:hypothetical protein
VVPAVSIEEITQETEESEVNRLLSLALPPVVRVFEHIVAHSRIHDIRGYLPAPSKDRTAYDQLAYVRAKHRTGRLTGDDYALLARTPQVFGADVYGTVEGAGEDWSWSFASAGVHVSSVRFRSEAEARSDLRELQLLLYPAWHCSDRVQRTAHLRQLIHAREQRRKLSALLERPALLFARRYLTDFARKFLTDSRSGLAVPSAASGYFPGDRWAKRSSTSLSVAW